MNTVTQRFREYLSTKGKSVNSFANELGVTQSTLNSMLQRGTMPSAKLINAINAKADLNTNWLLTGEGSMLASPSASAKQIVSLTQDGNGTPVYDIDATCGAESRDIDFTQEHIIGYVNLPGIRPGCCIIRANGDSMSPVILDGDWIAMREIYDFTDVFYGHMYLILTNEYRMLKYVRKYEPDEQNYIILKSENPHYDDMKLEKKKIRKVFIVESIMSVKVRI